MARKKVLHLKSGVTTLVSGNTVPKLPTSEQIELGEIAINYAEDYETLAIKNSNSGIVTFSNDKIIMDYVDEKTKDEVAIKYSGDPDPSSTVEIYIDETVDPKEADVYTQAQVDDKIEEVAQVNESGDTLTIQATLVIDENTTAEVEVYSKAQVDAIIQKLKDDNHLI
jgi:hypothetical protein